MLSTLRIRAKTMEDAALRPLSDPATPVPPKKIRWALFFPCSSYDIPLSARPFGACLLCCDVAAIRHGIEIRRILCPTGGGEKIRLFAACFIRCLLYKFRATVVQQATPHNHAAMQTALFRRLPHAKDLIYPRQRRIIMQRCRRRFSAVCRMQKPRFAGK